MSDWRRLTYGYVQIISSQVSYQIMRHHSKGQDIEEQRTPPYTARGHLRHLRHNMAENSTRDPESTCRKPPPPGTDQHSPVPGMSVWATTLENAGVRVRCAPVGWLSPRVSPPPPFHSTPGCRGKLSDRKPANCSGSVWMDRFPSRQTTRPRGDQALP